MTDRTETTRPPGPAEEPAPVVVRRADVSAETPRRRFALLIFLLSPLAVLALLCVLIAWSFKTEPLMDEPPVGAGAGETGMANEYHGIGSGRGRADQAPDGGSGEGQ